MCVNKQNLQPYFNTFKRVNVNTLTCFFINIHANKKDMKYVKESFATLLQKSDSKWEQRWN